MQILWVHLCLGGKLGRVLLSEEGKQVSDNNLGIYRLHGAWTTCWCYVRYSHSVDQEKSRPTAQILYWIRDQRF